jgi:flagellar motor switch protein FliM
MANASARPDAAATGTGLLANSSGAAAKAPLLNGVFTDVASKLATRIGEGLTGKVEIALGGIEMDNAGDALNTHAESIVSATITAEPWSTRLLAGVDKDFAFALIETVFGGRDTVKPAHSDRPLTRIELDIVKWFFGLVAATLQAGFAPLATATFAIEQVDCPPAYQSLGKPSTQIAAVTLELRCAAGTGRMFIAVPQSVLVYLNPPKIVERDATAHLVDPLWTRSLGHRVSRADVQMRALLGTVELTLGDIAEFREALVVPLDRLSASRVRLECNGEALYLCSLGQADGVYTLSVEAPIDQEQEFLDDILLH